MSHLSKSRRGAPGGERPPGLKAKECPTLIQGPEVPPTSGGVARFLNLDANQKDEMPASAPRFQVLRFA
jgi:hypothetical protein